MEEPVYGAIEYFFSEADTIEFREHYGQLLQTEVLQDAIAFVTHNSIRPTIRDAIIDLIIDNVTPAIVISVVDGIFNYDKDIIPPADDICYWLDEEVKYSLTTYVEMQAIPLPLTRQNLLHTIRSCDSDEFFQIIRYLRMHDEITDELDFTVIAVLIKRLGEALSDYRLFYAILELSVAASLSVVDVYITYDSDDDDDDDESWEDED